MDRRISRRHGERTLDNSMRTHERERCSDMRRGGEHWMSSLSSFVHGERSNCVDSKIATKECMSKAPIDPIKDKVPLDT